MIRKGKHMGKMLDEYIKHNGENLWDFEVLPGVDFENDNRIHPLKQRDVMRLVEAVKMDEHILAVIVFGSAVRFDCHSQSDLDVLVVREDELLKISSSLDKVESELDIIFSSRLGNRLGEEIAQTGVIVYRRDKDV